MDFQGERSNTDAAIPKKIGLTQDSILSREPEDCQVFPGILTGLTKSLRNRR